MWQHTESVWPDVVGQQTSDQKKTHNAEKIYMTSKRSSIRAPLATAHIHECVCRKTAAHNTSMYVQIKIMFISKNK